MDGSERNTPSRKAQASVAPGQGETQPLQRCVPQRQVPVATDVPDQAQVSVRGHV